MINSIKFISGSDLTETLRYFGLERYISKHFFKILFNFLSFQFG